MNTGLHNNYWPCNEHPVHRCWHETLQNYDYKSDNATSKRLSPAALFDESSATAKSPNSSSSSSMASSMGGGDEDTIGGIMLDMLASGHSIKQEAPYITTEFSWSILSCTSLAYISLLCCYKLAQSLMQNLDKNYFKMDGKNPHIICISKHHMKEQDLLHLTLPGYALRWSSCCRCIHRRCVHVFL